MGALTAQPAHNASLASLLALFGNLHRTPVLLQHLDVASSSLMSKAKPNACKDFGSGACRPGLGTRAGGRCQYRPGPASKWGAQARVHNIKYKRLWHQAAG
jgi:hypothetical protein